MPRRVKLQDTGEYSTSDVAFKVTTEDKNGKKTNKYWSSEEAYKKNQMNKLTRADCINKMYDVLNYKSFMKVPTFFYKKLSEWEPYGFDVVLLCMNSHEKDIQWAIKNKNFNSETAKIMYICAILENNMTDTLKQKTREQKLKKEEYKADNLIIENIDNIGTSKKSNDVSSLLGDI